jgi:homeodomain interacting protein kinase
MHDMFIQSYHTGNSSSGVALLHSHKKRKLEHQQNDYLVGGDNSSLITSSSSNGTTYLNPGVVQSQRQSHRSRNTSINNVVPLRSPGGGVPQQFIRASTIKLLDTYQRCGQKVR